MDTGAALDSDADVVQVHDWPGGCVRADQCAFSDIWRAIQATPCGYEGPGIG